MSGTRTRRANVPSSQSNKALTDAELTAALADDLDRTFEQFVWRTSAGSVALRCGSAAAHRMLKRWRKMPSYGISRARGLSS